MLQYHRLLRHLELAIGSTSISEADASELAALLRLHKLDLLNLLSFEGKSEADRKKVEAKEIRSESGSAHLEDIHVQLVRFLDLACCVLSIGEVAWVYERLASVVQALHLSDSLGLNELLCVELLLAADSRGHGLSGRSIEQACQIAAGIYIEERAALVKSLYTLLNCLCLEYGIESRVLEDVQNYVQALLLDTVGGKSLMGRLIQILSETPLKPSPIDGQSWNLDLVMDSQMRYRSFADEIAQERVLMAESLLCACRLQTLRPTGSPGSIRQEEQLIQDLKAIYSLVEKLSQSKDTAAAPDVDHIMHAVGFAWVSALLSDAEDAPNLPYHGGEAFVGNALVELGAHMNVEEEATHGTLCLLRLAWGLRSFLNSDKAAVGQSARLEAEAKECVQLGWRAFPDIEKFLGNPMLKDNSRQAVLYIFLAHTIFESVLHCQAGRELVKSLRDSASSKQIVPKSPDCHEFSDAFSSMLSVMAIIFVEQPELQHTESVVNFVEYVGEEHRSYGTLIPFLGLLGAMAETSDSRRTILQRMALLGSGVGWDKFFLVLREYIQLYNEAKPSGSNAVSGGTPSHQGSADVGDVMPYEDAEGLIAYLKLMTRMLNCCTEGERHQMVQQLKVSGKADPVDLLFSLYKHPVPPSVKAALLHALRGISLLPSQASIVFHRIEQSEIIQVPVGTSQVGAGPLTFGPVRDLSWQLNEVEARREEYAETLAFVQLLNTLVCMLPRGLQTAARMHRFSYFVRTQVFSLYSQRMYKDQAEKWRLASSCLELFCAHLNQMDASQPLAMQSLAPVNGSLESTSSLPTATGELELLEDLLGEGQVFNEVMAILTTGAERAMELRAKEEFGDQFEKALLASLRLVLAVFDHDEEVVYVARQHGGLKVFFTLDESLLRHADRLLAIVGYVRYTYSVEIRSCALRIMGILSERQHGTLCALLTGISIDSIKEGYAAALADALMADPKTASSQAGAGLNIPDMLPDEAVDDSGELIMNILLQSVPQSSPNLAHILLGYHAENPIVSDLESADYSCFTVLTGMLTDRGPFEHPSLQEQAANLFCLLCRDERTSAPTMRVLRKQPYRLFSGRIACLIKDVPSADADSTEKQSWMGQISSLFNILALELQMADSAIPMQRESCKNALRILFAKATEHGGVQNVPYPILSLLSTIVKPVPTPPPLLQGLAEPAVRAAAILNIYQLLESEQSIEKAGLVEYSERGDRLINVKALGRALLSSYRSMEGDQWATDPDNRAQTFGLIEEVLRRVVRHNQSIEEIASRTRLWSAWAAALQVALTRRYKLVATACNVGDAALLLSEILTCILQWFCTTSDPHLANTLSRVALTATAALHMEGRTSPSTGDVGYGDSMFVGRLPPKTCFGLLESLLNALLSSQLVATGASAIRQNIYAALLHYLHYTSTGFHVDLAQPALRALVEEFPVGGEDVHSNVEAIHKEQESLESGNEQRLSLRAHAILEILRTDLLSTDPMMKAVSYRLLDAILIHDRKGQFVQLLADGGILNAALSDISTAGATAEVILFPARESARHLYALEAMLEALFRVASSRQANGAERLIRAGLIGAVNACRAISLPISDSRHGKTVTDEFMIEGSQLRYNHPNVSEPTQRERQHRILAPLLRLMTTVQCALPHSVDVQTQLVEFLEGHEDMVSHVLADNDGYEASHLASNVTELALLSTILAHCLGKYLWTSTKNARNSSNGHGTPDKYSMAGSSPLALKTPKDWNENGRTSVTMLLDKVLPRVVTLLERHCGPAAKAPCKYRERIRQLRAENTPGGRAEASVIEKHLLQFRATISLFIRRLAHSGRFWLSVTKEGRKHLDPKPSLIFMAQVLLQAVTDWNDSETSRKGLMQKLANVHELAAAALDDVVESLSVAPYEGLQNLSHRHRRNLALKALSAALRQCQQNSALLLFIVENTLEVIQMNLEKGQKTTEITHAGMVEDRYAGRNEQETARLARELERPLARIKTMIDECDEKEMEYANTLVRRIEYVLL